MLVKVLKIRGHTYLDPIFVALCGWCQSTLGVQKGMRGKVIVPKISIEDTQGQQSKPITLLLENQSLDNQPQSPQTRTRLLSNIAEEYIRKQGIQLARLQPSQLQPGANEFEVVNRRASSSVRHYRPPIKEINSTAKSPTNTTHLQKQIQERLKPAPIFASVSDNS